jgi:hypothetical protein
MMGWRLCDRAIFGPLFIALVLLGPAAAGARDSDGQIRRDFAVAGVTVGMDFEQVLDIYPAAEIEAETPTCFSYRQRIKMPALTRHTLRLRHDGGNLILGFEPPRDGGRLSRIRYDHPVDLSALDIRALLDRLAARYGPHDRVLHRRKMEPAGRIVGLEWRRADGVTLRVVLHHDYGNGNEGVRLRFHVRSAAPVSRPTRRTISATCGNY